MMTDFLMKSPVAEDVKLGANVILHRRKMSTGELVALEAEGGFSVKEENDFDYELEVNGLSIARGSIVRKKGGYFFKVREMNGEYER